jgi:hypothetical protein
MPADKPCGGALRVTQQDGSMRVIPCAPGRVFEAQVRWQRKGRYVEAAWSVQEISESEYRVIRASRNASVDNVVFLRPART